MARGRFISNAIMSDQKINSLSDDTSRLAFTWLITTADSEGRTHGDPAMVRSLLFPRRVDVTVEQVESYIKEWHSAGLVQWYRANGDLWLVFPNFEKYQVGLRKEREPESQIPSIDDGELQPVLENSDGKHPANIRQTSGTNKVKRSKAKLREEKGMSADKPRNPTPPQIEVYRESAHRFPNKALWPIICDYVSEDESSLSFYSEVVKTWIALGWNPANIQGQLEFYNRHELPKRNGNGHSAQESPMMRAIRLAQQEPGYGDE